MFIAAARKTAAATGGKTGGILDVSAGPMGDGADQKTLTTLIQQAELTAAFTAAQA